MHKKKTKTDARGRRRDYAAEYQRDHASPKAKKDRAARNKARRQAGLKKGDPREADHVVPLSKNGSKSKSNVRIVSRKTNRRKGRK